MLICLRMMTLMHSADHHRITILISIKDFWNTNSNALQEKKKASLLKIVQDFLCYAAILPSLTHTLHFSGCGDDELIHILVIDHAGQ